MDYGYGPTSMVEYLLEHIHIYAGTPWWISIILSAFTIRAILFKGQMKSSDTTARMTSIKPLIEPLTAGMKEAQKTQDTMKLTELRQELSRINMRAGIKYRNMLWPMIQIPFGYASWKLLRAMSELPVPGFAEGGPLWFYNLAIPDPYFVLPVATSYLMYLVMKVSESSSEFHIVILISLREEENLVPIMQQLCSRQCAISCSMACLLCHFFLPSGFQQLSSSPSWHQVGPRIYKSGSSKCQDFADGVECILCPLNPCQSLLSPRLLTKESLRRSEAR